MLIIGCDFHTRYRQIAMLDETTGERIERRLEHENAGVVALDISPDRYYIIGRFREARNQISNS